MIGAIIIKFMLLICVINKVKGFRVNRTFRCTYDGEYLYNDAFCSGFGVCKDDSDETYGCDRKGCGESKFNCTNGPCMSITVRCNTIKDCPDGSDELRCGDEINVHNCSLKDGKFLCYDGLRCLGLDYTCDGYCNCFDCSDENEKCSYSKLDEDLIDKCPNSFIRTANGPMCLCDAKNGFDSLCNEIKNCTTRHTCDQRCRQFKYKKQCSCFENYREIPDTNGMKCRNILWFRGYVVYSTPLRIKYMDFTTNKTHTIENKVNCTAITASDEYVYYATQLGTKGRILKTSIKSKEIKVVTETNSPVTSIAIDRITKNIYFTVKTSLSVCSNEGRICMQIKCCYVKHVALASKYGCMFYSKKLETEPGEYIVKANMDGSQETLFVDRIQDSTSSFTVDEFAEKLYWIDDRRTVKFIQSITFDGEHKKTWDTYFETTPFSLSAYDNEVLFTKIHQSEVYTSSNPQDSRFQTYFRDNSSDAVRHIYAYDPYLNLHEIENPCIEAFCDGLCVLRPEPSTKALNFTCFCESSTGKKGECWSNNAAPLLVQEEKKFSLENVTPTSTSTMKLDSCEFHLSKETVFILIFISVITASIVSVVCYLLGRKCNSQKQFNSTLRQNLKESNERIDMCTNWTS